MITNISLTSVFVVDQEAALEFYTDKLGFELRQDVTMGDYRWLTVGHPSQPELNLVLSAVGPPLDEEAADFVARQLAKGGWHAGGLHVDDCRKTYDELSARGVEFVMEPADRPYGVEALMRDNSGNTWVLVEPKEYSAADFEDDAEVRA